MRRWCAAAIGLTALAVVLAPGAGAAKKTGAIQVYVSGSSVTTPILVTGVPGRVGGVGIAVVQELRRRGLPVRALVRTNDDKTDAVRATGAEVVVGDRCDCGGRPVRARGVQAYVLWHERVGALPGGDGHRRCGGAAAG